MRPRLEWLETFLAIVETGSVTGAAERIARSQSAVSLQLRQLEETVNARLFSRQSRRVTLTTAGETLVPHARRAVDAVDAASAAVGNRERHLVRAGVPEEYAERLVPGLLRDLALQDPALIIEVQCAASGILERRVQDGRLDLAFALAEEVAGPGEPVATDPVVWLQAPGSHLATRRPLPVALFDHACGWRNRAIAALAGIDFEIVFTSASVAGIRAGIRSGTVVGVLAASTAGTGLEVIRSADAPPGLAPAQLVLLRGESRDHDVEIFMKGGRRQLHRSDRPRRPDESFS